MSSFKRDAKDAAAITGWTLYGLIAAVIAIFIVISMWVWGWGFFLDHGGANRIGENQKKLQVEGNGSFRTSAYDHFFDLCASVQATEDKIRINKDELTSKPDAQRADVLHANITALESVRAEAIRQYNQDARKSYTIGQFRASDLPFELDPTDRSTSCTA